MISNRQNYSYLLDNLKEIANTNYYNLDNDEIDSESIIIYSKFYQYYVYAYAYMLRVRDKKVSLFNRDMVDRALSNYGVFNYFINTCIGEYSIYDDIGTGKIVYAPYQPIADFFFENEDRKEVLMNYLKKELYQVFNQEKPIKRVKA